MGTISGACLVETDAPNYFYWLGPSRLTVANAVRDFMTKRAYPPSWIGSVTPSAPIDKPALAHASPGPPGPTPVVAPAQTTGNSC